MFDDLISAMKYKKKLHNIVTELFLKEKKRNISFALTSQSYFKVPKTIRLNATYLFFQKFLRKEWVASIHFSHNDLRDYTKEQYKD